ncbi:hypothetical protein BH10CYA1_BH10CYA1_03280 [soil metagenome]
MQTFSPGIGIRKKRVGFAKGFSGLLTGRNPRARGAPWATKTNAESEKILSLLPRLPECRLHVLVV